MSDIIDTDQCRKCGAPMDMVKATASEEWWRCPKCGFGERHHIRPLIPGDKDEVRVSVLWKSGTRQPSESELRGLQQLSPAFASWPVQELAKRFEGHDRVIVGVFPWMDASILIERARALDLWLAYEMA